MSSSPIEAIVTLNAEGVQYLESKDYAKAISSLSTAITDLKLFLANTESQDNMDFLENGGPSCDLAFGFDVSSLQEQVTAAGSELETVDQQQTPFVFDTPIRVHQRNKTSRRSSNEKSPHEMLKMLSFALVFNLAISFHLGGLHHHHQATTTTKNNATATSPTTRKRLLKALAFYKMTLTMIQNDNLSLGIMETLAVSNNQAQVYHLLGKSEDAEYWKLEVLRSCMYVADCGQQKDVPLFGKFFSNCGVVKPSRIAAAA